MIDSIFLPNELARLHLLNMLFGTTLKLRVTVQAENQTNSVLTTVVLVLCGSIAWSFGAQLVVFVCSGISEVVLFDNLGSPDVSIHCFCRNVISDST